MPHAPELLRIQELPALVLLALEAAGYATQISVEVGRVIDSPARRNAAAAAERQRLAEETVMNDPYVQTLMREHGAKIVPGSIKPL